MRTEAVLGLVFASIFIIAIASSAVEAGEFILRTVPENRIWYADGREYRMDVYVDGRELPNDPVVGVQWRVRVPVGLENKITITRAEIPSMERNGRKDFFAGKDMAFQMFGPNWNSHARLVWPGQGILNDDGYVGSYWYTINGLSTPIRTSFGLSSIEVIKDDGQSTLLPYRIETQSFAVMPANYPKLCVASICG